MAKVYVPQLPSRFDASARLWVPTVNMTPAEEYGEIVTMLPPNANRLHTAPLVAAMREQMRDYSAEDFLVAVGDPSLIAAAAVIAASRAGGLLRILKWDRLGSKYTPVEMSL